MLINLSDVMSDQHRTVEETVECTLDEIRMKSGSYPVVRKEPVHVRVEFVKGKELMIYTDTVLSVAIPCDRCLEDVRHEFVHKQYKTCGLRSLRRRTDRGAG